jgi:hypothetical protein
MQRSLLQYFTIPLLFLCLLGCQSAPKPAPTPIVLTLPVEGQALMYLFRPDLDKMSASDQPTLLIDEHITATLGHATYTIVSLKPGSHQFQLLAGKNESSAWNIKQDVNVEAGQTHFVAIWHPDQGRAASASGVAAASGVGGIVGAMFAATVFSHSGSTEGVYFEPVEQDVGTSALAGLRFVTAQTNSSEALH